MVLSSSLADAAGPDVGAMCADVFSAGFRMILKVRRTAGIAESQIVRCPHSGDGMNGTGHVATMRDGFCAWAALVAAHISACDVYLILPPRTAGGCMWTDPVPSPGNPEVARIPQPCCWGCPLLLYSRDASPRL